MGGGKVILIGAGDAGEMALREIRNNPAMKFHVVGFLDDDPFKQKRRIHGVQVLGKLDDIGRISKKTGASEAIVAISSISGERLERVVRSCEEHNISCRKFGE
jgi:FlaA1/EpsC-like NDP-sugar epimerase